MKTKKCDYGSPYMTKDMSHIVLKLMLLGRIKKKAIYSYALLKEINDSVLISHFITKHGGDIKNDVYNTVKALEKSGYIATRGKVEDGRFKKYYTITKEGRDALNDSKLLLLKSMKDIMKVIG
jgi:DNA-binding PadR family transcriptional regulator